MFANHCLKLSSIDETREGFVISFNSFKHSTPGVVEKILVQKQHKHGFCPVTQLRHYLAIRGNNEGYLFIYKNGSPVSRSHFSDALNGALSFTGLSAQRYKGHSFRIGAATWAMQIGKTDSQIRVMGRWHSNAFLKYIRPYS